VLAQQAVADYYHVGSINVGKKLWEATKAGQGTIFNAHGRWNASHRRGYKFTRMK